MDVFITVRTVRMINPLLKGRAVYVRGLPSPTGYALIERVSHDEIVIRCRGCTFGIPVDEIENGNINIEVLTSKEASECNAENSMI